MDPRFVTKKIHAFLDYPVAVVLLAAPFLLGLGGSHVLALWLSVVVGAAALVLTLLTDHMLGVVRVLPYTLHIAVDAAVGVTFVTAPFLLGFEGLDLVYYLANGAAVLTVVSLHKPEATAPHPVVTA
ncbi:hypothetical protein OT109_11395 [Phycisphaeraceae bacterium D3-23]